MTKEGQHLTHAAYMDPLVVEGYAAEHAEHPKLEARLREFVSKLSGRDVIDLGCGPGQDTKLFAELGCTVVGMDYSPRMIEQARLRCQGLENVRLMIGNMVDVGGLFGQNHFDGAWVSASLLHIQFQMLLK